MIIKYFYLIEVVIMLQLYLFGCSDIEKLGDGKSQVFYAVDAGELEIKLKGIMFNSSLNITPTSTMMPHKNDIQDHSDVREDFYGVVWDQDPVPEVNTFYSFDQKSVKILLEFIQNPEYAKLLSQRHLYLIRKYVYEWFNIIQEPLRENQDQWNEELSIFNNHIPRSLGYQDIVLRNIIRIQLHLQKILEYSNDIIWKEQVFDKISDAEALTGLDIYRLDELEGASASLALLASTYNLHPFELYPLTIKKDSSFIDLVHATLTASSNLLMSLALEWLEAAKSLLKDDVINVWKDIYGQKENRPKPLKTEENYWLKLKTMRESYEREREDLVKRKTAKLERIFPAVENSKDREDNKYKTDYIYLDIVHNIFKEMESLSSESWNIAETNFNKNFFKEKKEIFMIREKLCRGSNSKSMKEMSMYSCRLDSRNSPYLLLMPVKVEELNKDPEVMIFHHIMEDKKIHEFQQIALPIASAAKVGGGMKGYTEQESLLARKSYTAWIEEVFSKNARTFNHLVGQLTGYSVSEKLGGVEYLQINSYISGGFYHSHKDAFEIFENGKHDNNDKQHINFMKKEHPDGDRIATFMIYMNDDMIGGRTIFPHLRLSVAPKKGSAIYWSNLHLNGSVHELSLHAGCQVLAGVKWVANKWILSNEQMFRKPCAVEKHL